MPRTNKQLFKKVQEKTGLSRAALYGRIKKKANSDFISNDIALLKIAAQEGVSIQRFAKPDQFTAMRATSSNVATGDEGAPKENARSTRAPKTARRAASKAPSNSVFVVHGRDSKVRDSLFQLLRALGLNPIEWNTAVGYTREAAPHISKVLDAAFKRAAAAVVLFTPDDEARLQPQFHRDDDEAVDTEYRGQARPNVLFEAGIALALRPKKTVLVEVGKLRPFTDISGMHIVRLTGSATSRQGLVTKLKNAGCSPTTTGTDWLSVGEFTPTAAKPAGNKTAKRR